MKKLVLILFVFGMLLSCETAKKTNDQILQIEMNITGRSGYTYATFNKALYKSESKGVGDKTTQSKVSAKGDSYSRDWEAIVKTAEELDLTQLNTWEAPTDARLYDGAAMVVISIRTATGVYESMGFDQGEPPAQLEKLYSLLENVVNQ